MQDYFVVYFLFKIYYRVPVQSIEREQMNLSRKWELLRIYRKIVPFFLFVKFKLIWFWCWCPCLCLCLFFENTAIFVTFIHYLSFCYFLLMWFFLCWCLCLYIFCDPVSVYPALFTRVLSELPCWLVWGLISRDRLNP